MVKLKKIAYYLLNILLVLGIFIGTMIITKTYPFGDFVFGKSDAIVQFKPMLYNFIMAIKTHTISPFSFNNGLGNPIVFDFIYYLASPLNLIALLFNNPDYMYLSCLLLKLSLTAVTITFYAKKKTNNNFLATIICLSYVFSSWFFAYYYYLPWLDIFLIFPLFQYGLEKLLNEHKFNLYIFTLSFTLIANFYLAFPVCLYTLIYFIISELIYKKQTIKEKVQSFNYIFLSTLFSFILISFYIYILYSSFIKTGMGFSGTISTGYTLSILDFIKSLFFGNISFIVDIEGATFPNIALNTMMLISFFYFFINTKITKKDKIFTFVIVLLFIFLFFNPFLNYIANFFHNIRGLTYRYSFIPIFLIILMFIKNANNLEIKDLKKLYFIFPIITILLFINYKNMEFNILVFNIVFILIFLVLLIFYNKNQWYKLLIILVIIVQSTVANSLYFSDKISKDEELIDDIVYKTEPIKYRLNKMDNDNKEYLNKNLYSNDKMTYLLSSMTYNSVVALDSKLGCSTFENTSISCPSNGQIFDMLLNVKNDYYLEKLYAVNKDILNIDLDDYSVKNSHDYIIEAMTGIKDIYDKEEIKGIKIDDKYHFKAKNNYYLIDFITNDNKVINEVQTYEEFTSQFDSFTVYNLNKDKLDEIYQKLSKNQIKYTHYEDSKIEGTINVDKDQVIFTSIPYDSSWQIKVDGKKVKPSVALNCLMVIECSEGKHTISLEYKNNYIIPIIISVISLIIYLGNILYQKKKSVNLS